MKTTMGKRKKFFRAVAEGIVALSVAFNFVSCGKKTKTEATVLSLGISADDEAALAAFTKQFNAENEDVQVTLRVYATESEKNYYHSHNADDCDMYAFNYAFSANRYKDRLLSLDRNACTNRYLVSIVNGLRASDESLYVLPADGYYYTQCFNVDMLTARGPELPSTFTDLKMLASRLKAYASGTDEPSSASVGGTDSVLFALMSVAYPQYLNTVRGATFLSRLADGGVSVLDEEYRTEWEDIFENLQMLYDENFYSLQDISQSLGEGLSRFNGGEAYALQNGSNVNAAKDISKDLNVKYTAFVGNEERDACFGSMPALYLSLSASMKDDGAKLSAAQRILDYFATAEGQNLLHRPDTGNEYISYLKRSSSNLPEIYADLQAQYKGSGLGLAISAQLVSLMGGKISVNSKRDEGSDFIVEIPFEISEATVKEAAEADMGNIVPFENIRVLLAEDNELNKRNCFGPSARKRDRSGVRRERKTGLRYVFCA